ncbi:MAG: twin-arginine translocation signal domain-containing protein, partial [Chloroflexi bacterium]|nr:twin-arginine translocation signal domain-containing protein [Chloroflexota bacterium]
MVGFSNTSDSHLRGDCHFSFLSLEVNMNKKLSRRDFLKLGGAGIITAAGTAAA